MSTPMPSPGDGSITHDPLLADIMNDNYQLMAGSPCRDTGLNTIFIPTNGLDRSFYRVQVQ